MLTIWNRDKTTATPHTITNKGPTPGHPHHPLTNPAVPPIHTLNPPSNTNLTLTTPHQRNPTIPLPPNLTTLNNPPTVPPQTHSNHRTVAGRRPHTTPHLGPEHLNNSNILHLQTTLKEVAAQATEHLNIWGIWPSPNIIIFMGCIMQSILEDFMGMVEDPGAMRRRCRWGVIRIMDITGDRHCRSRVDMVDCLGVMVGSRVVDGGSSMVGRQERWEWREEMKGKIG
jgi:hypothetical protein